MKTFVFFLILIAGTLVCAGCGMFNSGLESEFAELKDEPTASDAAGAKAQLDKATAFVERVGEFDNPPEGLMSEARKLQMERAAAWALKAGTEKAKKVAGEAKKLFEKLGDKLTPDDSATATSNEEGAVEPKGLPLTPEEKAEFEKNSDPTSDTIPSSGKPERKKE